MRYILDFIADTSAEAIADYLDQHDCEVIEILSQLGLTYLVNALEAPPAHDIVEGVLEDSDQGVSLMALSDTVEYKSFAVAEENNWWKLAVISGLDFDADNCSIVRTGHGYRVYLMDSGIDETHPEFADKDIVLLHSKTADFTDTTGHGTALASVIVGEECGITEASLRVVKIIEKNQPTLVSEILVGLQKIAEDYEVENDKAAVLNISWGIAKNAYIETKLAALMAKGIIVVAASGNSGAPIGDITPASMAQVITVGSFGQDLVPSNFTSYTGPSDTSYTAGETNHGPGLDLFAPGEGIRVACPGGAYGYTVGTSIAAAITSACTVINLAISTGSFAIRNYEATLAISRETFVTRGVLTLTGKYTESLNVIPRARLVMASNEDDAPHINRAYGVVPTGSDISIRVFDAPFFVSAEIVTSNIPEVSLVDNFIVGIAPVVEEYNHYSGTIRLVDANDVEHIVPFAIFVFNPDMNFTSAEMNAMLSAYDICGCHDLSFCCEGCNAKLGTCNLCAGQIGETYSCP